MVADRQTNGGLSRIPKRLDGDCAMISAAEFDPRDYHIAVIVPVVYIGADRVRQRLLRHPVASKVKTSVVKLRNLLTDRALWDHRSGVMKIFPTIHGKLDTLISAVANLKVILMADFTALNAAIADLGTKQAAVTAAITANDAEIQTEIAALKAAIAAGAGGAVDQAAVDAATANIVALSANSVTQAASIATETTNLAAAVPAAPAPGA